jgi:prevent-host-death family protein
MLNIVPITDLQMKTKKYVKMVQETGDPIVITQRGRVAAVLSSAEDFEGHLMTLDEMSYPDWQKRLARAERELRQGKSIELEAYLKRRRKSRHRG